MEIVYSAANSLEAHMIKGMLEQQAIPAYIQGEHLQSGIGELPAISGFVKISVDNDNVITAKKIINEWEAMDKEPDTKTQISNQSTITSSKNFNFLALVTSFIVGAISMHIYLQAPEMHNGIDINGDGKIDNIATFENGLLVQEKSDVNFDGDFETENFYTKEVIYYSKSDLNNDGEIDTVVDYEPNGDFKTSIFDPKTKLIKKIQFYKNQHLSSAELDTNDDGKMDVLVTYNFFEEEVSRSPIQ